MNGSTSGAYSGGPVPDICHDPRVEVADIFRRWLDPVEASKLGGGFESIL